MQANKSNTLIHLQGEPCYKANCTLAAVDGCVATPWNRQKIAPAFSAYSPSMDIHNYSASWRLAYMDVGKGREQDAEALPCTTASAHFTSSN